MARYLITVGRRFDPIPVSKFNYQEKHTSIVKAQSEWEAINKVLASGYYDWIVIDALLLSED